MASHGSGNELTELVTQMKGTVEQHFLPLLDQLEAAYNKESSSVKAYLEDLKKALQDAHQGADAAFTQSEAALRTQTTSEAPEVIAVAVALTQYQAHLHETGGKVQELVGNVISQSTDLSEKLSHADEVHGATHDQIVGVFGNWNTNVDGILTALTGHEHEVTEGWHLLGEQTNGHATDLMSKLQQAGELVTQHVTTVVQLHAQHSEELVSNQKEHMLQNVAEQLGGHAGDMISHLGEFGQVAQSAGHVFDGGIGEVLQGVDSVMNLVHPIEGVLKVVEELAG